MNTTYTITEASTWKRWQEVAWYEGNKLYMARCDHKAHFQI